MLSNIRFNQAKLGILETYTKILKQCENSFTQSLWWLRYSSLPVLRKKLDLTTLTLRLQRGQDALKLAVNNLSGIAVIVFLATIAAPLIRSSHIFLTDNDFTAASLFYSYFPEAAQYYGSPKRVAKFASQDLIPVVIAISAWIALTINYKKLRKARLAYIDVIPVFIFIAVYQLNIFAQAMIWPTGKVSILHFTIPFFGEFYLNSRQWFLELPVLVMISIGINGMRKIYPSRILTTMNSGTADSKENAEVGAVPFLNGN